MLIKYKLICAVGVAGALVAPVLAQNENIEKKTTTTQQTYQNPAPANAGTSAQGAGAAGGAAAAGAQTPAGGMQIRASTATPSNMPMAQSTFTQEEMVIAQTNPTLRWNVLKGEVTHVDQSNKVVEIRLKGSDAHVGVPVVEKKVALYKHGDHQYDIKDISTGDDVTIRNLQSVGGMGG